MANIIFNWDESEKSGTFPPDTLDRAKYASFLTGFLINEAENKGYVLNINAPWGTGKTYFLNRWLSTLSSHKYPVVYIDAWKQDFSNDPMLTIIASIESQLKRLLPNQPNAREKNIKRISSFLRSAAPLVGKSLTTKALNIDLFDLWEEEKDESNSSEAILSADTKKSISSLAESKIKELVSVHNATLDSIETFKTAMKIWIETIVDETEFQSPTFIFIDELDRCRPTYAVQMLEVIKHFFEMEGVVFVIATDTSQLQFAIKAIYGEGFGARTYLGRFFNSQYSLSTVNSKDFIKNHINKYPSLIVKAEYSLYPSIYTTSHLIELIERFRDIFNLTLREIEQLIEKLTFILSNNNKPINLLFLIYLMIAQFKDRAAYKNLTKKITSEKAAIVGADTGTHVNSDAKLNIGRDGSTLSNRGESVSLSKLILASYYTSCELDPRTIPTLQGKNSSMLELAINCIFNDRTKISFYVDLVEHAIALDTLDHV